MTHHAVSKFSLLWLIVAIPPSISWKMATTSTTSKPKPDPGRRSVIPLIFSVPMLASAKARALDSNENGGHDTMQPQQHQSRNDENRPFVSSAFTRKELTNSIVASQDTNISPAEVYETILRLNIEGFNGRGSKSNAEPNTARALDVGAGAGVSTQVIFQELGFVNIDAVDWSGDAWRKNVVDGGYCPPSVNFYELDDERFVEKWKKENFEKYDIVAFNFAVNRGKALYFCNTLLKEGGLLLAPINTQDDYWLKQTYQLLDADGKVVWSATDVGAWSVQFQPDVTQDTCQGVWCSPFNGFQKLRR
mmetsp:Transcript_14411/g.33520  ORF Transcript_14411/g.33520 Transcript_14411/m.33520 type:complete len:305 (-) Transcript_14411:197-1111(-)